MSRGSVFATIATKKRKLAHCSFEPIISSHSVIQFSINEVLSVMFICCGFEASVFARRRLKSCLKKFVQKK